MLRLNYWPVHKSVFFTNTGTIIQPVFFRFLGNATLAQSERIQLDWLNQGKALMHLQQGVATSRNGASDEAT